MIRSRPEGKRKLSNELVECHAKILKYNPGPLNFIIPRLFF